MRVSCFTIVLTGLFLLFQTSSSAQIYLDLAHNSDLTFDEIVDSTEAYFDKMGREKGHGYKPFQRWKYEMERSLLPNGKINSKKAQRQSFNKHMASQGITKNLDITFEELGPKAQTNTSTWSSSLGRLSAIGLDRNDQNHIIVGSPSGGIWKTNDRGTSWTPIYDFSTNINIRSLEISHASSNHYWAGTSESIFRSTDGGKTWSQVINGPNGTVNTITMDPKNAQVLLATDRYAGKIYRSSDGGQTWTQVYNHSNSAFDLEFHPTNSNIVYASGSGFILKSTNNGTTWNAIRGCLLYTSPSPRDS